MKSSFVLSAALLLGLTGIAQASDVNGALSAVSRLLSRNSPTATAQQLAQTSQYTSGQSGQIAAITYDDEVVAESFRIFAQENRRLFDLVSVAGRSPYDKQAACAQIAKQIDNNKGLYSAITIRPTQITVGGVGLYENNADLQYASQALGCY